MLLTVENVEKSFPTGDGPLPVLRSVSLTLGAGETLALTGESGSGKSTLLYLIGALDRADEGEITVSDTRLSMLDDAGRATLRREAVGIIFQQFNLVPSLTVHGNLRLAARLGKGEDEAWTTHLADRLGLRETLNRYPEQLSGGQQQRVAIGRTLAARPALVLADEPTGNLDEATAEAVIGLLVELVTETGAGLLTVTHSARLATAMERRIHLRAGRIEAA